MTGQRIAVTPGSVEFTAVKPGNVYSMVVQVTNLNKAAAVSIRIRPPATRVFQLSKGSEQTQRIAPGLSLKFEVTFDGSKIEAGSNRDFHDSIKISTEAGDVDLLVHARPPKPELQVKGDLQFGMLAVDSKAIKQLQLVNKGLMPAEFNITWDKTLPIAAEPCAGILQPSGSNNGNSSTVSVRLLPVEVGAIVGELAVAVAGRAEPYRLAVNATAVQQSCEIIDPNSSSAVSELHFGPMFFGEAVHKNVAIFNNGPTEVRFDLSYGSAVDMKAIAGADQGEEADGGQHAAFMQMARVRAKALEEKDPVLKVSPISGVIAPYCSTQLQVRFKPVAPPASTGFAAQPLEPQKQAQLFDCLVQVSLAGGSKFLLLPIKGTGLAPQLAVRPQVMHFGVVPTYEWADQLLALTNGCTELPMQVVIDRSGPYFTVEPPNLLLPPGASTSVLVKYLPKALGRHQAALSCQVVSIKAAGHVLSEISVQVQGSSLTLGQKQPLPGGISATPDTFQKRRAFVDESETTIAQITSKSMYKRQQLWETAENAYSLDGIGPMDRFGLTRQAQMARAEHAAQYTAFIQAGRIAAARKHLTQKEGNEKDPNIGMKPYRGLNPARFELPKQVDPLWTLKENSVAGPAVQRPPSAAVLASISVHKEWPETPQERSECTAELAPAQLSKVVVGPRQLDYGKISPAMPSSQTFVVTNSLTAAIHVVLDLGSVEGLSCTGPASQVIPAGCAAKFQLVLHCHDVQVLKEKIQYCINGCHMQSLELVAEVVAVTLELPCEELMFNFSLENWDSYVEQGLIMENPHNFPVDFEWSLSSSVFSVSPLSGTVRPKGSCSVAVRWTPSNVPMSTDSAAQGKTQLSLGISHKTDGDKMLAGKQSSKGGSAAAAAASNTASVTDSKASTNKTAVTVELPAEAVTEAALAPTSCQHTGFMTLVLKGGADAAPKKVTLHGELPAGLLKFKEKEVNLGPVPVGCQQTAVVQLKNLGNSEASYRVISNAQLAVSPDRGRVAAESASELEVVLWPKQPGQFAATLEVEVRGSKTLKLPFRADGVIPSVHIAEAAAIFSPTFCGGSSTVPVTLVNTTPVPATLLCDLTQQPEFEVAISREDWAGSGYAACPVQRIGANGDMSTVGSKRASRRITSQGARHSYAGECGYKFLIQLKPSSTLPIRLAYRPSKAQSVAFQLPMVLQATGHVDAAPASSASSVPVRSSAASAVTVRAASPKPGSAGGSGASAGVVVTGSKPGSAGSASKAAEPTKQLAVPVSAVGMTPRLIISQNSLQFGSQVVRTSTQPGKSPYSREVYIRNNTDAAIQVAIGMPAWHVQETASLGAYTLEGVEQGTEFISLGPEEGTGFTVRFTPTQGRSYDASVPIYIDGNRSVPYMQLSLTGLGTLPRLTFDVAECLLPAVPLNVESHARFYIINGGYDNLELSKERVRLPPDTTRLPVKLSFPEGNLIGLAKDKLPVDVTFCSSKPLSFTALIDFLDESGRAFSLAVTGAADNCSLTMQPFLQLNAQQLKLVEGNTCGGCLQLENSPVYQMPREESIGPVFLTPGICKYLSAVTSRSWGGTGSRGNSSSGTAEDGSDSPSLQVCEELRKSFRTSKGKQLQELVETLGGKAISMKGAGNKKLSGNKTDAAQQALAVYEAILNHLRAHGALVNSVKPEYLLDHSDFERIMEARNAAAAGNPEEEQALELWAPVELVFGNYSTQAWNCVLVQVFKIYVLARVTPAALRQLLGSTQAASSGSGTGTGSSKQGSTVAAAAATTSNTRASQMSKATDVTDESPRTAPLSSTAADATIWAASSNYEVPPDDVLASSNMYSTAEASLLAWMTSHMANAFPTLGYQVTNFSDDLRNGLVLGALLNAHWPGGKAGSLVSKLHQVIHDNRHLRENQEMVVRAWQELCLPYGLSVSELDEAEPCGMLLLVTYLFTALPQLLPRATLDFTCKLGESQVWDVQLANPTRRPLSYAARLEGNADFALEASMVKIEPGRTTQVPVRFIPTTSLPKTCRLVLMSRRDGGSASAATLVFLLKGQVDSRSPIKQVAVQAPLYQLGVSEFSITNPFPADCDFSISIVPIRAEAPVTNIGDKKGKESKSTTISSNGSKAGGASEMGAASNRKTFEQQLQQQLAVSSGLFPDVFGLERHRLRLRAGASEKLKLSFLPFQMPPLQQQPNTADGQPVPAKPVTNSLLVLSDSDCGEFAYELCGEVLLPAPFMEHKATVGLDGQQTVELALPFVNHILEAARRTYAEKHPLAKDKEQAAKLRSDIGCTIDKGERVLEYSVSCSNTLISCPQTLVLKAGMPYAGASMSDALRSGSPDPVAAAVAAAARGHNSISGGVSSSTSGAGPLLQQQSRDKKLAAENVLKLGLKPVGCGIYPARLTLTSVYDVRVVEVEVTAQSLGQQCVLELECPARQQVLQEVPLINSSDGVLTASATLTGKGYSGPRELTVQAKGTAAYLLTFCPPGSGTYMGTLELYIAATGERNVYTLIGKGGEPLAEGHIVVDCQARSVAAKRLQVPNITRAVPLVYSVYSDLECLSGPATFSCSSANRGDTYKLSVMPLLAGTTWGSISFVTEEGQYCWYSLEVRATEPPGLGSINVSCQVRQAVAVQITLTNPTDKPLTLRADYSCPSLVGPSSFVAPPKEPAAFECYYAPLLLKNEEGVVRLIGQEAGEFWWRINMEALPSGPERLPLLVAPLGRTATHTITVGNPTAAESHFICSSSDATKFTVSPGNFTVPAHGTYEVQLDYMPGSLGVEETATVTMASNTAGSVEYICKGQGEMPTGAETSSINAALGTPVSNSKLTWLNPFDVQATVRVQLLSTEASGTFSLQLSGVQTVQQQQQQQAGSKAGSALRNLAGTSASHAGDNQDLNQDIDHLERQQDNAAGDDPVANLLAAALGVSGGWAAGSSNSQQSKQQQQQQGPVLQQYADVAVKPHGSLQLPIRFCPAVLREAAAQLVVTLQSPTVTAPEPLLWNYQVQGLAHADAGGVKFTVKCKARQNMEEVLPVPLPGLDPGVAAAIAAAAGAQTLEAATGKQHSPAAACTVGFKAELIIPDEHKAALAAALRVEPVDQLPVNGTGQAAAPVLRLKLLFAPQKAMTATVQLAVTCSNGARWVYEVQLTASAPEIEGTLVLEAHMGCTAELPLMLYSSGAQPQPFSADFTPETPLNFDVLPAQGMLPPAPVGEDTEEVPEPMIVTFLCKELGKVMTGKLKVVTPDSEHTFIVKGRQPAYVPPQRSALPSGRFLKAATASSIAHSNSSSPTPHGSSSPSGRAIAQPHGSTTVSQARRPQGPIKSSNCCKNYLQQNIKSAGSGTGRGCSGVGSSSNAWQ